jgi:hypothetical protein
VGHKGLIRAKSLPTRDSMTVNKGAAGKAMVTFRSNICSKLTEIKNKNL